MDTNDYLERVYAGVLGKIIGVYMGRPFEGWTYERIMDRFGEVSTYRNEEIGVPLVVTDDDIAGTFTFIRALEDYGYDKDIRAEAIGQTWLNYIVDRRTILWWGGLGNSTEHTAYLRLKGGIKAPASGSAALNGTTVANQIGAQIFIDGWALVSPGDPAQAARLAKEAASVSHDEEAVNAAVVIAAFEAEAFVQKDIGLLLDDALSFIPRTSLIARLTGEVRARHRDEPDWRAARAWLDRDYGYDTYKGVCHVVPNYALIILSLLYGEGDFRTTLKIANTCGRDTDCNAGNVGCMLGVRNGLPAIEACPDLRIPHGDLLFLSSADGGRCISDAAREAYSLANIRQRMTGQQPVFPKNGARYNFDLPGAVHAFHPVLEDTTAHSVRLRNSAVHTLTPSPGQTGPAIVRVLEVSFEAASVPALVAVPVFLPPDIRQRALSYEVQACPSLYPGQVITGTVSAESANLGSVGCRVFVSVHGTGTKVVRFFSPVATIQPGKTVELEWKVGIEADGPIFEAGLELQGHGDRTNRVYLHSMSWDGTPDCVLRRSRSGDGWWQSAWVNGVDEWGLHFPESFHISQNTGTGLLIQGMREWSEYEARASITPFLAVQAGLAVCIQGMRRYYALVLCRDGFVRLIKELDGTRVLAEKDIGVKEQCAYDCRITTEHSRIVASVDGHVVFDIVDTVRPLEAGAVGLLITEGTLGCDEVRISSAKARSRPA
jgi:ADP-ribosylglycohydrolase